MKAIEVKDLVFSYDGSTTAVDHISFDVEQGKFVSIVGHNGSGKSTIAKLIAGLIEKKSGTITIFDKELNLDNLSQIRSKIGIVFQNPDNQFISATVKDDIAFGLENKRVSREKMVALVHEYAAKVGMSDFLNKEPSSLSGGQKQRVAIAGVLVMTPDIVILDEATSMLDPKGKSDIRDLIIKMRKENPEMTILSITHDIEEAFLADEVLVMNEGKILLSGKPSEVFKSIDVLHDVALDVPFEIELKEKLAKIGLSVQNTDNLDDLVRIICQLK
ncbi:MAG: energy-coupling factor transporter ATPase [Erysipelotrichaceae bacterium]|jgi:energy-coupling factor transport system ATP-binding protein|nr:energy-coupling factor transporter ATPase [Erysipelotrichaceae bacterium]